MQPGFRKRLLQWYQRHARSLPWRSKPEPYRVWVSEIMLQQTRVEAVREPFQRFMKRFPTVRKLAAADVEQVLEAWSGLGYYRRARMLHRAAQQIVELHKGRFPETREHALNLPGIGPYTAGAILSIAFDQPEPIVDGNVERVFSRLNAFGQDMKSVSGRNAVWQFATSHVQDGHAEGHSSSALNQALMELGATICTPSSPDCEACPVAMDCAARREGRVDQFPRVQPRAARRERTYHFLAVRDRRSRILLVRRPEADTSSLLPAGMWELPQADSAATAGIRIRATGTPATRKHAIMDYRLTLRVQPGVADGPIRPTSNRRWFTPEEAERAAIASATRKLLHALGRA
ncbi:MAG: A/G-specific adenine glycosylase [Planctomycetes bacterium]|nr:A/G-specific adenine glycosylase [Planctomycetota bacterium]